MVSCGRTGSHARALTPKYSVITCRIGHARLPQDRQKRLQNMARLYVYICKRFIKMHGQLPPIQLIKYESISSHQPIFVLGPLKPRHQ